MSIAARLRRALATVNPKVIAATLGGVTAATVAGIAKRAN
jgi:hypothetical protein